MLKRLGLTLGVISVIVLWYLASVWFAATHFGPLAEGGLAWLAGITVAMFGGLLLYLVALVLLGIFSLIYWIVTGEAFD